MSIRRTKRQIEIVDLAVAVAEEYSDKHISDPFLAFKENEIGHTFNDYGESFDGMLEFDGESFFVFLNTKRGNSRSNSRGRFTASHELGHFFIDEHRRAIERGVGNHLSICGLFDNSECEEEHEADLFAANFLMPPDKVKASINFSAPTIDVVQSISDRYNTSFTSAALQFLSLTDKPSAIINWNSDKEFRWIKLSSEASHDDEFQYWNTTHYKDQEKIPFDSATGEVLFNDEQHAQGNTTASTVFINVKPGDERDRFFDEECFRLGDYGFITLLTLNSRFQQ